MDKVLKQRLIGATILIALAVIFLPMLFDGGDDERTPRQLALDLPDRPGDQREVRRLPLDPDQARQPPRETEAEPPREPEVSGTPELPQPIPEQEPRPPTDQETERDPETRPEPEPVPEFEPEPAEEPTPDPVPADVAAVEEGDWVVQVAVFSSRGTAERVQDQLDGLGHGAWIDPMTRDQAELYRLRTGPYASREDAETARGQIARTVSGVEPAVRSRGLSEAAEQVGRTGYAVQVGSFASRNNADRLVERLAGQGYDAFIHSEESGGRMIHRVRVGSSEEREEAETLQARLRDEAGLEGIVVSHP
jgi:DedD protein